MRSVSELGDIGSERTWTRDARLWGVTAALVAVFVLDVRLPEIVLLPFMCVPVVAAATFAGPRLTGLLAVVALALGVASGIVNGDFANDDYWIRLAGLVLVSILAVYLAHLNVSKGQRLAASELRYRLLADNSSDAILLVSGEGIIDWASPAVRTELGYEPADLVGRPHIDFVHFEDRRSVQENEQRVVEGERAVFEERFQLKSGEYRWVSVALRPFVDEAGSAAGRVAALRDVHSDVLLRDALSRSERTFRLAMDSAAQGMAVVGLHHRLIETNGALCTLVGRDARWLSDHEEDDLLHPDEVEPTRLVRDRLLNGQGDHESRTSRLVTAGGGTVWVAHGIGLLRDEYGLPLFFVCQYYDLAQTRMVSPA
jgi:PAS domain S-box-containing protein